MQTDWVSFASKIIVKSAVVSGLYYINSKALSLQIFKINPDDQPLFNINSKAATLYSLASTICGTWITYAITTGIQEHASGLKGSELKDRLTRGAPDLGTLVGYFLGGFIGKEIANSYQPISYSELAVLDCVYAYQAYTLLQHVVFR